MRYLCLTAWYILCDDKMAATLCMEVERNISPTGNKSKKDVSLRLELKARPKWSCISNEAINRLNKNRWTDRPTSIALQSRRVVPTLLRPCLSRSRVQELTSVSLGNGTPGQNTAYQNSKIEDCRSLRIVLQISIDE
jgi:hypothetical protein